MSILIKDTTREEREKIVAESIGNISGSCDGCMSGLVEMYQDYIDGKKEIRDINMEFKAVLIHEYIFQSRPTFARKAAAFFNMATSSRSAAFSFSSSFSRSVCL